MCFGFLLCGLISAYDDRYYPTCSSVLVQVIKVSYIWLVLYSPRILMIILKCVVLIYCMRVTEKCGLRPFECSYISANKIYAYRDIHAKY